MPVSEEAVAIQRQLGISLQTSNALREYAAILIAAGKMHDALDMLAEAIILFNKAGLGYYTAITKLQQAELLLEMGHADEAYEQAELLKKYFDEQNLVSRSVRAALVMVGSLMVAAQPEAIQQAIILAKQVSARANQHNLQEEVYKSNYLLGQLFDLQGSMQLATKYYAASIDQIEHILDHLVSDLSPDFLHTTWIVYEKMIAHCLKRSQFTQAFMYLERARSMALRQHLHRKKASREQSKRPISVFLTKRYNIEASALCKLFEIRWKSVFRLHSSLLLCAPKALAKLAEAILSYLFVRKTLIGLKLAHLAYLTFVH
jgi:tetratricopeptide (TPR) repeat protein